MSERFDALFRAAGARHALDWRLLKAIARHESVFNPRAVNPRDPSYGLMQVSLPTARALGFKGDPSLLLEPEAGIEWGTRALADIATRHRTLEAQLAVYNGGEKRRQPRSTLSDAELLADGVREPRAFKAAVNGYVARVKAFYGEYLAPALRPLAPVPPELAMHQVGPVKIEPFSRVTGAAAALVLLGILWLLIRALARGG